MALVLREKKNRKGETKSFNVVRAEEGEHSDVLANIAEGEYKLLDSDRVHHYRVSYRTVQDLEKL